MTPRLCRTDDEGGSQTRYDRAGSRLEFPNMMFRSPAMHKARCRRQQNHGSYNYEGKLLSVGTNHVKDYSREHAWKDM